MARTAVVAGTATAVSGSMHKKSAQNAAQQQEAAAQVQAQQATAAPAASTEDRMAKIRELGQMKSEGLLTDEEFAAEKAKLLAG